MSSRKAELQSAGAVNLVATSGAAAAAAGLAAAAAMDSQLAATSSGSDTSQLPIFDLAAFLEARDPQHTQQLCEALAECLHNTSALVVRDPRVDGSLNERFLNLMERYFDQPLEAKLADVREGVSYQVGATPEGTEKPRCLQDASIRQAAEALAEPNRPTLPTGADAKWRFFWRVGKRPADTQFAELNAQPVVPAAFREEWTDVMDTWGSKLLQTVFTVAEMAAQGLGLQADAFTSRMQLGPHLLAPTGADLGKHNQPGTVFAGFHYDLNMLTIHGRSRYPGLFIWLRDGRRMPVRIPEGCLLLQAGKQMEWLTGGHVRAGFHEVICTEETLAAAERARQAGRPTWRVSSTVFSQVASDQVLQPLGRFATQEALAAYPALPAGRQVQQELELINLKAC